jgi:outer membrane protein TolC
MKRTSRPACVDWLLMALALTSGIFGQSSYDVPDSGQSVRNLTAFHSQLSGLMADAVSRNHSVKASTHRIEAAAAEAQRGSTLNPPQLEIEAMDASINSFPNPFKDQMRMEYSLEQMFMFPGKLSRMKRARLREKDMLEYEKTAGERNLLLKVKNGFYELYLIDRRLAINAASQLIVSRMIDIARAHYEVGLGRQADILRAQTEMSELRRKSVALDQRRRSMVAMINALRDKPVETPIDTVPEIVPQPVNLPLEKLQAFTAENAPELKAMRANLEMKKAEASAVKLEAFPDFSVKATYSDIRPLSAGSDPMTSEFGSAASSKNPDRWSIMVGMTIPPAPWSWKKTTAGKAEALSSVRSAQEELDEAMNLTKAEVLDGVAQVQSAVRQLRLVASTLLPQARQAFESAMASYGTGGQDFTMVLDAQRTLLTARDDYHMTVMNYLGSLAVLEQTVGGNLDSLTKGGMQ